jgi:hypothetical protein
VDIRSLRLMFAFTIYHSKGFSDYPLQLASKVRNNWSRVSTICGSVDDTDLLQVLHKTFEAKPSIRE